MWLARDKDGELYAYKYKPQRMTRCYASMWSSIILDRKEYPEVTWENSPVELVPKIEEGGKVWRKTL